MRGFKLRAKISMGFAAVIAVMIILSTLVFLNLGTINSQATALRDVYLKFTKICNDTNLEANLCAIAMLDYDNTGLAEAWERAGKLNEQKLAYLDQAIAQARDNAEFSAYLGKLENIKNESQELTRLINATRQEQEMLVEISARLKAAVDEVFEYDTQYMFYNIEQMQKGAAENASPAVMEDLANKLHSIKAMDDIIFMVQEAVHLARLHHNLDALAEALVDMPEFYKEVEVLLAGATDARSQELLQNIGKYTQVYESTVKEFMVHFTARGQVEDDREKLDIKITSQLGEIAAGSMEILSQSSDQSVNLSKSAIIFLIIGVAVAIILGCFITIIILRNITRPVAAALDVVQHCQNGDFSRNVAQLHLKRGDELGEFLRALASMSQNLSQTFNRVTELAQHVSETAGSIRQSNFEVSEKTQQQASAIEQTASTVEQMTGSVRHNAQSSQEASQLAQKATTMANNGGQVLERTVRAMQEVSASSNKINDIINVVNEIAFQTNLLALNAAVEAARAGEAGRGFAVVAGEVRNLAGRSATAAKEIRTLISDSVEKVDQGNQLVSESGRILSQIIEHVNQVSVSIRAITSSGQEQAAGIEEINRAVGQMDQGVQQNAALVEEAASASELMAQVASELLEQMNRFKTLAGKVPKALPQL